MSSIRAGPLRITAAMALVLALAGAQQAEAQSVYFSGFTQGCFGVSCSPVGGSSTLGGLTYTSTNSFEATTTYDPVLGIHQASVGGGTNNFGTFTLTSAPFVYSGQSFTLLIEFIDPTSNQNTFAAALRGTVSNDPVSGGVRVDLDNSPQFWTDGSNGFIYSVAVNDLSLTPGQTLEVSGDLTATVPEPISMFLIGTGLAGVGIVRRRRTAVTEAEIV